MGNEKTYTRYDDIGRSIGKSKYNPDTGRLTNYDSYGHETGYSEPDSFFRERTNHYNSEGKKIGYSTPGITATRFHYDNNGNEIGLGHGADDYFNDSAGNKIKSTLDPSFFHDRKKDFEQSEGYSPYSGMSPPPYGVKSNARPPNEAQNMEQPVNTNNDSRGLLWLIVIGVIINFIVQNWIYIVTILSICIVCAIVCYIIWLNSYKPGLKIFFTILVSMILVCLSFYFIPLIRDGYVEQNQFNIIIGTIINFIVQNWIYIVTILGIGVVCAIICYIFWLNSYKPKWKIFYTILVSVSLICLSLLFIPLFKNTDNNNPNNNVMNESLLNSNQNSTNNIDERININYFDDEIIFLFVFTGIMFIFLIIAIVLIIRYDPDRKKFGNN